MGIKFRRNARNPLYAMTRQQWFSFFENDVIRLCIVESREKLAAID